MLKPIITVVGSYAVGMTMRCTDFPVKGETVEGSDFQLMHGGKGSNQAVACARLGGSVNFATCVGEDSFGEMCYSLMRQECINTPFLRTSKKGSSTGVGFVCVNDEGENEIVISLAANYEFDRNDIDLMVESLNESNVVLMQLEMDMNTVEYMASKCKEKDVMFVLNVAPYKKLSDTLLKNITYLILNEIEARQLVGCDLISAISDEEVANLIIKKGVGTVIMTLGQRGALIASKDRVALIPAITVKAVDTTGAGDVFCGAFCVGIAEGKQVEEAVKTANICAGLAVTKYGVVDSIPDKTQLEIYLKEEVK